MIGKLLDLAVGTSIGLGLVALFATTQSSPVRPAAIAIERPSRLTRSATTTQLGPAHLQPCTVGTASGAVTAECGTLTVFENRTTRRGRTISIHFMVLRAERPGAREALLMFAGGPGDGSVVDMAGFSWTRPVRATMDILIVDQRGTGDSRPLNCESTAATSPANVFGHVFDVAWVRRCRVTLEAQADLTQYTTDIAVEDIEDVRAALGYERVCLYGASYGTRMAQGYMRRHGSRVIAAVLDGVVPFDNAIPLTYAASAQQALDRVFVACAERSACRSKHPALPEDFRALVGRFDAGPIAAAVTPPGAAPVRVTMSRGDFAYAVRGVLYSADAASTLPDLIGQAVSTRDVSQFAQRYWERALGLSHDFAYGVHWSVLCAEDIPFITNRDIITATANTFIGSYLIDEYRHACAEWPRARIAKDFRAPVTTSAPTLLVSGAFDPVTPPQFAERVGRSLPLARVVISPATAHVSAWGCARAAVLYLLIRGTFDGMPDVCR